MNNPVIFFILRQHTKKIKGIQKHNEPTSRQIFEGNVTIIFDSINIANQKNPPPMIPGADLDFWIEA
jgi:hypothetical protein